MVDVGPHRAVTAGDHGCVAIVEADSESGSGAARVGAVWALAVNANLVHPRVSVPLLRDRLDPGDHRLAALVYATPTATMPGAHPPMPAGRQSAARGAQRRKRPVSVGGNTGLHLVGLPFGRGSLNPARTIAPALLAGAGTSSRWLAFVVPPLTAAVVVGLLRRRSTS